MMGIQRVASRAACSALLGLLLAMPAVAATTGTRFEPGMSVQGTPLVLNGTGTRFRAIFKVYDMGMYLPRKVGTREEVLAMVGPKRLEFTATRDLDSTDIGLAFVKGMRANATREQMTRHTPGTTRLIEIFSGRMKLNSGDRFSIEYVPGKGTTFYVTGEPQGAPVPDPEFFAMVLNIWLGDSPAEPLLKDALLGR